MTALSRKRLSDRRQANVWMRANVVIVLGAHLERTKVIEEYERTYRLLRYRRFRSLWRK